MADLPPPETPVSDARPHSPGPFLRTASRLSQWASRIGPIAGATAAVGAAAVIAAIAPLAASGWAWVWSRPHADHVLLGAVGLMLIAAAAAAARGRGTQNAPSQSGGRMHLAGLIAMAWAVVVVVVLLLVAAVWWAMDAPAPRFPTELAPRSLDAIATRAFAVIAGLGGAALLVINYRRQRTTEAENDRAEQAAARDETRLFTERFTTASEQLGSDQAAVRLAGVHALAHLADDAPTDELVQMVIDVLCAYLRMPYNPAPLPWVGDLTKAQWEEFTALGADLYPMDGDAPPEQIAAYRAEQLAFAGNREVRHTIIRVIGDHLRVNSRWRSKNYDFTGVAFDGGDFSDTHFTGGNVTFRNANFANGSVSFRKAVFSGATVDFNESNFSGGTVVFTETEFSGGSIAFVRSNFSGGVVAFIGTEFSGGLVEYTASSFCGATVHFYEAAFLGGKVSFDKSEFSAGEVSFNKARFTGGQVSFIRTEFAGDTTSFVRAAFLAGEVRFLPLASDIASCPTGLLEAVAVGTSDVVSLPDAWRAQDAGGTSIPGGAGYGGSPSKTGPE